MKKWCIDFFFREEGGKRVLNRKRAFAVGGSLAVLGVSISLIHSFLRLEDTSRIERVSTSLQKGDTEEKKSPQQVQRDSSVGGIKSHPPRQHLRESKPQKAQKRKASPPIRYKAKQVISRSSGTGGSASMPTGTSFVGKTLNAIDTRTSHKVKVILPYGGSHKGSGAKLPKSTILLGKVSYPGEGKRVHIGFKKAVLPDGQEIPLKAEALSSKDYSPGVIGEFHGNTTSRMASVLGLSMVSGMSEVLVEKEALGQGYSTTPKATVKNGLYNGVAKVTDMEASRQAEKLAQKSEYVTVEAGSDLIVSLTGEFKKK